MGRIQISQRLCKIILGAAAAWDQVYIYPLSFPKLAQTHSGAAFESAVQEEEKLPERI